MALRIATTRSMLASVRAAGYQAVLLPPLADENIHRSIAQRLADGAVYRPFLERERVDLVIDVDTSALTLTPVAGRPDQAQLTAEACGVPHACLYVDPITATMNQVPWDVHWSMLERPGWIKAVWDGAHAEELVRLGVPNVVHLPMAANDQEYDTAPAKVRFDGPVIAFMGHPATSWFRSRQPVLPEQLLPGFVAAAVNADQPGTPFHRTYFDLYRFGEAPAAGQSAQTRSAHAARYFQAKFVYNAYLALRQRDRFVMFLKQHLGDRFELIGDFWSKDHGLSHQPTIRDYAELYRRMRETPICLNLVKGNLETGVILRHFEVTAVGGFLLTYWTRELPRFFEIGKECETFRNEAELLEKVRYYLAHPRERQEVALAGQRRTLREHLYRHRIEQLVDTLRRSKILGSAAANPRQGPECREVAVEGIPHPQDWASVPGGVQEGCAAPRVTSMSRLLDSGRIGV